MYLVQNMPILQLSIKYFILWEGKVIHSEGPIIIFSCIPSSILYLMMHYTMSGASLKGVDRWRWPLTKFSNFYH